MIGDVKNKAIFIKKLHLPINVMLYYIVIITYNIVDNRTNPEYKFLIIKR